MDLVPNRWYAVLEAHEVPAGRPVAFERAGRKLVFWRDKDGVVRCADDRCPHRGASMSTGYIKDGSLQCRYHGFEFDGQGACTKIPAHPKMRIPSRMCLKTHTVREAHQFIWFFTGAEEHAPAEVPFFDFSGYSYAGTHMKKPWPTHYARVAENELDWSHLAFVHRTTIGRGFPAEVDVNVSVEGDHIKAWVSHMGPDSCIELLAPNVWRLALSTSVYNFLVFAPVNDEEMVIYGRTYQKLVTVPGLDWMLGKVWALANPVVLAQDEVTVTSQRPKIPGLQNRDVLVPSDKPVLEYFRWRRRAQQKEEEGGSVPPSDAGQQASK